jgi:hypothetical protein
MATAGAAASNIMTGRAFAKSQGWANRTDVNPAISNLRVVCCFDPTMTTGDYLKNTMAAQNAMVVASRVQLNLDEMAKSLAQKSSSAEAWKTIFQKPSGKEFTSAKVAIKLNCKTNGGAPSGSPMNNPRIAIIDKVCKELNNLGVPYGNITLYDATAAEDASYLYGSFVGNGIPAGVKVSGTSGVFRSMTSATIPYPAQPTTQCVQELVNNSVDILIDITINKAHSYPHTGYCSLTMKNHLGTFAPQPHETDYLLAVNKSDAILGGTPPRQQLCIVDSLWSNVSGGPTDPVTVRPDRIIMGTFGPALDYLTVKKIREEVMGATHDETIIARFLTDFGYQASDVQNSFILVPAAPATGTVSRVQGRSGSIDLSVNIEGSLNPVVFSLEPEDAPPFVTIVDLQGRIVRELPVARVAGTGFTARWDGRDESGRNSSAGDYLVTTMRNGRTMTHRISYAR